MRQKPKYTKYKYYYVGFTEESSGHNEIDTGDFLFENGSLIFIGRELKSIDWYEEIDGYKDYGSTIINLSNRSNKTINKRVYQTANWDLHIKESQRHAENYQPTCLLPLFYFRWKRLAYEDSK